MSWSYEPAGEFISVRQAVWLPVACPATIYPAIDAGGLKSKAFIGRMARRRTEIEDYAPRVDRIQVRVTQEAPGKK